MKRSLLLVAVTTILACTPSQSGNIDSLADSAAAMPSDTSLQSPMPATQTVGTFRAVGQEPGWLLSIEDTVLTLRWDYDERRLSVRTPVMETVPGGRQYLFTHADTAYAVRIADTTSCADGMSGHQYPATVSVTIGRRILLGCGGEPGSLIKGAEWIVDSLDGRAIVAGSRVTLQFSQDGRITGNAGCNRFGGNYTVNGSDLTTSQVASTRMACTPDIDKQEVLFLSYVEQPLRFYVVGNVLHLDRDRRTIVTARRP